MRRLLSLYVLSTVVVAALLAAENGAASDSALWVTDSRLGSALLRVDPVTGERALVDLYDYPVVIDVRAGVQAPGGDLYLEAINAQSLVTVVRFDPTTGSVTGISGLVDRDGETLRGAGPDFQPGLRAIVTGPWARLYALRRWAGPMAVDIATGDRTIVSQSADPPVGSGVAMTDPLDLVAEHLGSLLVADRFAGLVRVGTGDGTRSVAFVFDNLVEAQHRVERLPDGRVLHAFGSGDSRSLSVLDLAHQTATELSGPQRGSGPAFAAIVDFIAATDGLVYVLDLGLRAIVVVDPSSGDRRIVAEDPDGADLGLLSSSARLVGATVDVQPAPRRPSGRRLAGDGPLARAHGP